MNKTDKTITLLVILFGIAYGVTFDMLVRGQFVLGGEWLVWIFPMAVYWLTRGDEKENRNG